VSTAAVSKAKRGVGGANRVAVVVPTGAAGRIARGVQNRNGASVESIGGRGNEVHRIWTSGRGRDDRLPKVVVAVERTVKAAVPVLAAVSVKAAVQMGTSGTKGVDSGSPVAVGVAAGAAGRVARGVRNRNDASVESID
jgi:hypothetical protein